MNSLASKLASGIARLSPFGKRTDDPLTHLKATANWIEGLPIGDAFKCQQLISNVLKRFNENATHFTKDRLAIFMLLDERSRDLQDTLMSQYLRNPRMSRPQESQLWHAVYGLYWEIARGYHAFVLHISHESEKTQRDEHIPLITLRAIQAFGQLLKWRAIRYLPAGEKLWFRLHNLYRIAETGGFQRLPQQTYSDDVSPCNCEAAYLHIMMLNLANSGTLYPKQIDLLDHWLCGWHAMLQLDSDLDPDVHNFSVDLSSDQGPRRVRKPDAGKPMRFWTTANLLPRLNELHTALRKGELTPAQLGLTEKARTTESIELIDHLLHQWSSLVVREQRRAPRESIKRLVDVVHGINAIVNQIQALNIPPKVSPYGTGLDYNEVDDVQVYGFVTDRTRERVSHMHVPSIPNSPDVERWVMHDESECGYGAIVESQSKDWLRVGALVGLKPHETTQWRIGIVRRLSRLNDETSSVGIEVLAETPSLVMLHDNTPSSYTVDGFDNTTVKLPNSSLWLTSDTGTDSIIIDPVHFMTGKLFQAQNTSEHNFVVLGSPIERSEGWMRVAVEPVKS